MQAKDMTRFVSEAIQSALDDGAMPGIVFHPTRDGGKTIYGTDDEGHEYRIAVKQLGDQHFRPEF